jgi:hypothetical protein
MPVNEEIEVEQWITEIPVPTFEATCGLAKCNQISILNQIFKVIVCFFAISAFKDREEI